ncbi:MAG TPA: hypothetical protein PL169_16920 [Leptospiraceae bacterium]|nr:hypothetical protein [Leptospiraceae bacterium]
MNLKIKFLTVLLFIFPTFIGCSKAVLNHIAEGASGILTGFSVRKAGNKILVSGNPETMNEGDEIRLGIKMSQSIRENLKVAVETSNPEILINDSARKELIFTPENSSAEQSVAVRAVPDGNRVSETVKITLSASGIETTSLQIKINDTMIRNILISGGAEIAEESVGTLKVSLGIKPTEQVNVSVSASDSSAVIQNQTLIFSPENYSVTQDVKYSINDSLNSNRDFFITASADSEQTQFKVTVKDNDFQYLDISAGQPADSAYNPALSVDSANGYIYIAARNVQNSSRLGLFRCTLNGTGCIYLDASAGQGADSAHYPKIALDQNSSSLLILTSDRSVNMDLSLFRCGMNMVSCSHTAIAGGTNIGYDPKIMMNSTLSKIHLLGIDTLNLYFLTCDTDGTNCTKNNMGTYAPTGAGYQSRGAVLDEPNGLIYSVNTGGVDVNSFYVPIFKRFNVSAASLISQPLSLTARAGMGADLKADLTGSKIFAAAGNWSLDGRPWIYKCDLDGLNCDSRDITAGTSFPSFYPSLNIDKAGNRLLITAVDNLSYRPFFFHCDMNGENCSSRDISFGKQVPTESYQYHFDSAVDAVNNRLILVFTDKTNGKLGLIRFGLGGF